jgi:FAD/FMN-containing dehydrogenase
MSTEMSMGGTVADGPRGTDPADGLLAALRAAVGPAHLLVDAGARAAYETDWTGRFAGTALAVVRPAGTDEVVAVLRACAAHATPVVPRGGGTGLVGGAVPLGGEVVLSLERLDHVGPVDVAGGSVVVGAGATLAAVDRSAADHGLAVGVDLASRDSATIGGMVATDAGGVRVIAHGPMRRQVLGLEAVLADGSVLRRIPGLAKDGTGYALPELLAGSEGTLAVVTAVHLRLVPRPVATTVLLLGCADVADALGRVAAARRAGTVLAAELVRDRGVRMVHQHAGVPLPLPEPLPPLLLLLELDGDPDRAGRADALAALVGDRPAAIAADVADARRLWAVRERHTEAVQRLGTPTKLDVTVPPAAMAEVLAEVDRIAPDAVVFGHIGDASLHVNLLDAPPGLDEQVLRLVAAHGGSIAAEHGIGVAKAHLVHLTRDDADVAAMRAVKRALDPTGLLNPGKVLPPDPPGS